MHATFGASLASTSSTDNEALIESSYRRLLASIESEREQLKSEWQKIEEEHARSVDDLETLRQATAQWRQEELDKVDAEWSRLIRLRQRMSVERVPQKADGIRSEVLEINCSGEFFSIDKEDLCVFPGSYLNHIFSDAFIRDVPSDETGRFFLDFNPNCFRLVVQYIETLKKHRASSSASKEPPPPPPVPPEHQHSMDLLADALLLKPFLAPNRLSSGEGTSLRVIDNTVEATHPGWQVVCARQPLRMISTPYFEVKVLANPEPSSGGLAVGVCGRVPDPSEVHTIRFDHAILLNGRSGIISDSVAVDSVGKGHQIAEGSVIGIKYDLHAHSLHWYVNKMSIGYCTLKPDCLENMRTLYPVFAMYVKGQKIQVELNSHFPAARKDMGSWA